MKRDSKQYLQFENERNQPAIDLAKRIVSNTEMAKSIIDVGCGPGNSTAILKTFFPEAEVLGVDNTDDMLTKAKAQ